MANILMFDDVTVALLPPGYSAYAGYVDGAFENIPQVRARFPGAHILTIAVRSADVADVLDVEPGDATDNQAASWFRLAMNSGVSRPCLYTSASNVDALVDAMTAAHIPRTSYRIWSAHYGAGQHLCGPGTCRATSYAVDATQFTSRANNENLDESVCLDTFFTPIIVKTPGEPVLIQGDTDAGTGGAVTRMQERLNVWKIQPPVHTDGDFGILTHTAVTEFQKLRSLTTDGIVGPQTWAGLMKVPPVIPFKTPVGLRAEVDIVDIAWDAVPTVNGKSPTGYRVSILDAGHPVQELTSTGTSVTIKGLARNKVYEIEVSALGGEGTPGVARIAVTA
jgi:hypothetical protein